METKNIYRNLLSIYKFLPTLISSIDRLVEIRGVGSSNCSFSFSDTAINQANNILALTNRKVLLINLRVATNTILSKLKPEYSKLLVLRYIDGFSTKFISEKLSINLRTCFRKIDSALKSFSSKMGEFIHQNENIFLNENKDSLSVIFKKLDTWDLCDIEDDSIENKNIGAIMCNSLFKDIKKTLICN